MNFHRIIVLGLLSFMLLSCSDDGCSSGNSDDGVVQELSYDGKSRVLPIEDGASSVVVDGVKGKKVYFVRANASLEGKSIRSKNVSYAEEVSPQKKSGSLEKAKPRSTLSYHKQSKLGQKYFALKRLSTTLKKEAAQTHEYEIPTKALDQLTKNDIVVGETKRVFKISLNRYYDEDGEVIETPDMNYKDIPWIEMEFVAKSVGDNVIVWVPTSDVDPKTGNAWTANDMFGKKITAATTKKVTQTMTDALRDKFETILPYETELFGERSSKIFSELYIDEAAETIKLKNPVDIKRYSNLANFTNILVYDMEATSFESGTFGYFSRQDFLPGYDHFGYSSKLIPGAVSNEGNFLYINSRSLYDDGSYDLAKDPKSGVTYTAYQTLAHEYMHSLQFARKIVEKGLDVGESNVPLGEMLGQLSEYIMGPKLGVPVNADVVNLRYESFMIYYSKNGILEEDEAMYEMTFAFGVFLLHNYGGQKLLSEMVKNGYDGWEAIKEAIKTATGKEVTEEELAVQFIEAHACYGSDYAKKMNGKIKIQAKGETIERDGVNVFDLREHGYYEDDDILAPKLAIGDATTPAQDKLHSQYGFLVGTISYDNSSDTVSFKIANTGTPSSNEKLYVMIGDEK